MENPFMLYRLGVHRAEDLRREANRERMIHQAETRSENILSHLLELVGFCLVVVTVVGLAV